jgi:hypothetical protein
MNQLNERGEKHGYWEHYYEGYFGNGELYTKGEYVDGKMNGLWESFYNNGQLLISQTYLMGVENGNGISYYENGAIKEKSTTINGVMVGNFEFYYDNGQLMVSGHFVDGKMVVDESHKRVENYDGLKFSVDKGFKVGGSCNGYLYATYDDVISVLGETDLFDADENRYHQWNIQFEFGNQKYIGYLYDGRGDDELHIPITEYAMFKIGGFDLRILDLIQVLFPNNKVEDWKKDGLNKHNKKVICKVLNYQHIFDDNQIFDLIP